MPWRHILIVRASAIGDFVLNLPALRALAIRHPEASFTLVGYPETLELAARFIPIRAIHSIEREPWRRLFHERVPYLQELAIDAAFVWMKDPAFAEHVRASGVGTVHQAAPFPEINHAAAHLLASVALPVPDLPDCWRPGSSRVIFHPGSGSPLKSWPRFAELAQAIPDAVALIGPCEGEFRVPGRSIECLAGLRLTEVAEALCECRQFVGSDSGIAHLAAYLGCPTLALFGPTDPRVWGPIGRRVEILWKPSLGDISVKDVLERMSSGGAETA